MRTTILLLFISVYCHSQSVTFGTSGNDSIVYFIKGNDTVPQRWYSEHPLYEIGFDSIDATAQQAILKYTGLLFPITSSVGLPNRIRQLITAGQNALANKKPEFPSGLGGVATQLTSKSTAVTVNNIYGRITTHNAALAAGAEVTFTVNNSLIGENDDPHVWIKTSPTIGAYNIWVSSVSNGSFTITISNVFAGSLNQAIVINFDITKLN